MTSFFCKNVTAEIMYTSIYSEYFSQLLIILLSWWKKKPYDFGRRCIKYFCIFLFIYYFDWYIYYYYACCYCFYYYIHIYLILQIPIRVHWKKKKLETKLTKAIIFGIFLLSKPPYFLNTKSGKQRTAHIYMRYLGQVATNWVHTWYKKNPSFFSCPIIEVCLW